MSDTRRRDADSLGWQIGRHADRPGLHGAQVRPQPRDRRSPSDNRKERSCPQPAAAHHHQARRGRRGRLDLDAVSFTGVVSMSRTKRASAARFTFYTTHRSRARRSAPYRGSNQPLPPPSLKRFGQGVRSGGKYKNRPA